ncbi:MAG TPA: BTAD domain-containing putative transcriptional regulator [Solirubrobacterales bacterium]
MSGSPLSSFAAASSGVVREVEVELFDGFRMRTGAKRVELPLSAQRVLAFLALQRRPVQRLYVAGTLWTDSSEERSLGNLRSALWRLRRPAPSIVDASGGLLELGGDVAVDIRALNGKAQDILDRRVQSPPGGIDSLLHGDLLPDWYDDWVVLERERLRHLRLHALESLCEQLAAAGRHWEAIEAGLAAVRADPLRESAHRALIQADLAEGNAAEAVRHYREFRALLKRDLGLAPSPLLRELVAGLPV